MRMSRVIVRPSVLLAVGITLLRLPAGASAEQSRGDKPAAQPQAAKPAIYDTTADAKTQIAAALAKAKRENQREKRGQEPFCTGHSRVRGQKGS